MDGRRRERLAGRAEPWRVQGELHRQCNQRGAFDLSRQGRPFGAGGQEARS